MASKPPEARGQASSTILSLALSGHQPPDTLISNFQPPELGEHTFLLSELRLLCPNVWCFVTSSPRKRAQVPTDPNPGLVAFSPEDLEQLTFLH